MKRSGLSNRRVFLKSALTFGSVLAAPSIITGMVARASGTQQIQIQLGWLINAYHVGDIVAQLNGYFEEAGLDVEFLPGGPSADGVASVASGRVTIGQTSSSPTILNAVSQSIPIKAFAVGSQRHPFAYFSRSEKPVRTPQDLIGKKVGMSPTSRPTHRAFLNRNGIDEDAMELSMIGSDKTPLLTGQVDVLTSWTTDLGALSTASDLVIMPIADNGLSMYALIYYAMDGTFPSNHAALEKYVIGAARGWEFARAHPEEATSLMVKQYPNLDLEKTLSGVKIILHHAFNSETKEGGWGTFSPDTWQQQIDLFAQMGEFTAGKPELDKVMTTSVLSATAAMRPKLGPPTSF